MKLRRVNFDLLVIPSGGMNKNAIKFSKLLGIKDCRWHTPETEFDDRNHSHVKNREIKHEALSGFALFPELGNVTLSDIKYQVYPQPDFVNKWLRFFEFGSKKRIGLFVSNNSASRQWPRDKWRALVKMLADNYDVYFIFSPYDNESLTYLSGTSACPLLTESVNDLVAAMTFFDVIVSADSAPVHLSSALNIPVIALFESRPEKYIRWHPLNVDYTLIYGCGNVDSISVSDVFIAVIKNLKKQMQINVDKSGGDVT